jgi:outer membrane protein
MRHSFLSYLFFFLIISGSAHAQQVWTLEQCLTHALEKNIQIKQAELNQKLSEANLFQNTFQMFSPSINADLSGAVNFGRFVDPTTNQFVNQQQTTYSGGISARLTLFSGLSQYYNMKQQKMGVEASKFETETTRNNVMLTITRAFLQILLSKEELKAVEMQMKLSAEQFKQAEILLDAGTVPLGNKLDAEAQLVRDSLNFMMAQNALGLAKLQLAIILQLNPDESFDVQTPALSAEDNPLFLNETAEQVYQTALTNQPSIKSAKYRAQSAKYRLSAARGLQSPTITAFSNLRTNYSTGFKDFSYQQSATEFDTVGYFGGLPITTPSLEIVSTPIPFSDQLTQNLAKIVGVSINIPILNGWQTRNSIKTAKLNWQNTQYQQMQAENQLKQDVYTSFADAKNSFQSYHSTKKSVEAFRKSLEYNEERYNVGALNSLQYNTARTNFANAEIQHIRAKYDYIFKLKVLDFYKGNAITLN